MFYEAARFDFAAPLLKNFSGDARKRWPDRMSFNACLLQTLSLRLKYLANHVQPHSIQRQPLVNIINEQDERFLQPERMLIPRPEQEGLQSDQGQGKNYVLPPLFTDNRGICSRFEFLSP